MATFNSVTTLWYRAKSSWNLVRAKKVRGIKFVRKKFAYEKSSHMKKVRAKMVRV
jgi:hypothetical protein